MANARDCFIKSNLRIATASGWFDRLLPTEQKFLDAVALSEWHMYNDAASELQSQFFPGSRVPTGILGRRSGNLRERHEMAKVVVAVTQLHQRTCSGLTRQNVRTYGNARLADIYVRPCDKPVDLIVWVSTERAASLCFAAREDAHTIYEEKLSHHWRERALLRNLMLKSSES